MDEVVDVVGGGGLCLLHPQVAAGYLPKGQKHVVSHRFPLVVPSSVKLVGLKSIAIISDVIRSF